MNVVLWCRIALLPGFERQFEKKRAELVVLLLAVAILVCVWNYVEKV